MANQRSSIGIPVSRAEGVSAENHAARAPAVLVVEDEEALRIAVSKLLGRAGMFVMEAADGSSALQRLRGTQQIDVVILDITIPGATSQEVFAEVRRLRPEARVLITSAHPPELAAKELGGPIRDFIRKPYRVAEVVQMIRHAV